MFGLMRARTCARHTDAWRNWRNHYCGTCKTIGSRYGQAARMALNHDTVFLAELLTALSSDFERSRAYRSFNCMSMPKQDEEMPTVLRYSAAATLVLAEFKVIDHIDDTGKRRWRALGRVFSKAFRDAQRDLVTQGFPIAKLSEALSRQSALEREGKSLADFSAPTAEAAALFFGHGAVLVGLRDDGIPSDLGHKFGELAYLLDAFEDYEKDHVSGAFNAIQTLGWAKRDAVPLLQKLVEEIRRDLERLPLKPDVAAAFAARLKANLDAKLGLHICTPRRSGGARLTRQQRWENALKFARGISASSPKWRAPVTVGAVALIAYLAPAHSRAASTPAECLSLSFNLMALGSMFAMAAAGDPPLLPPVDPAVGVHPAGKKAAAGKTKSGCCGSCGCDDCCCEDACDACSCSCCACESCECCSSGCSGCGDCCGSCDCGGCDC